MLHRPNSVCFLPAQIDACALWRLFMPHLAMPGSGFYCFAQKPAFELIAQYDVAIVQRCCTASQQQFINNAAMLGMKVIYDLDDDVWDLPPYNPAHAMLSQFRQGFTNCIRMVDLVTVSTQTLAKTVRRNVKMMVNGRTGKEIQIAVCENKLLESLFVPPVMPSKTKTVIGWGGSSSHIGDLELVLEGVKEAAKLPDVVVEFRGCDIPPGSGLTQLSNFRHKYWMPVSEYGGRMPLWGWNIALAPVTDHPFNASKSCIKMIEAAYCHVPCLASWVRPYEEFTHWDKELEWLLCAGQSSWTKKILELVNDRARREELGERCYKVLQEHYTLTSPVTDWERAVKMALSV